MRLSTLSLLTKYSNTELVQSVHDNLRGPNSPMSGQAEWVNTSEQAGTCRDPELFCCHTTQQGYFREFNGDLLVNSHITLEHHIFFHGSTFFNGAIFSIANCNSLPEALETGFWASDELSMNQWVVVEKFSPAKIWVHPLYLPRCVPHGAGILTYIETPKMSQLCS